MGLTFEQQYKDVLIEFANYCNMKSSISLVNMKDVDDFIKMKMGRWK